MGIRSARRTPGTVDHSRQAPSSLTEETGFPVHLPLPPALGTAPDLVDQASPRSAIRWHGTSVLSIGELASTRAPSRGVAGGSAQEDRMTFTGQGPRGKHLGKGANEGRQIRIPVGGPAEGRIKPFEDGSHPG